MAQAPVRDVTAERLARARATIAAVAGGLRGADGAPTRPAQPERIEQRDLAPIERMLGGAWIDSAYGRAFVRDRWFASDHEHGSLPLSAAVALDARALQYLLGIAPRGRGAAPRDTASFEPVTSALRTVERPPSSCPPHLPPPTSNTPVPHATPSTAAPGPQAPTSGTPTRMGFFDIETTGLGGGTGTYLFLAGLGTFEPHGFRLRQYFLADVGGERAMLALMAEDLARCDALVTYNGRAFDVPIVETRLTLARLRSPCAKLAHFDLLHPVRRLYKHRMPSCRLADAERRLLGIERFDDTPGSLMPAIYFAYVRAGQMAPLRGVFEHNAYDVLSLVGVLARLARLFTDDAPAPDDAAALARWWERDGADDRALRLYRSALPWLEGGEDWAWAAHRHARLSRRAGMHAEAAALWVALWERGDAAAGLALAKHLEHRAREYAAAEAVTLRLLAAARGAEERAALAVRLGRLRRKGASIGGRHLAGC